MRSFIKWDILVMVLRELVCVRGWGNAGEAGSSNQRRTDEAGSSSHWEIGRTGSDSRRNAGEARSSNQSRTDEAGSSNQGRLPELGPDGMRKIWARSFIFKSDEVLRYASW